MASKARRGEVIREMILGKLKNLHPRLNPDLFQTLTL